MKHLLRILPLAALLGVAPLTVGCSKSYNGNKPDYEARVNDQLKSANLDNKVNVNWKNDDQTLHLTGKVDSAADKRRAEELAQQVVGTSGHVVNEVAVEGVDYGGVDDQIENRLSKMFEDRTEWDFDGRGVSFDSKEGVVSITGTVESQAIRDKIEARARATAGVKDVVNDLKVKPKK